MQDALYAFFLERVRTNLHVILCVSPVGEAFRERCRMFPGLVNCTTIDWFTEWPSDALFEVASKQLQNEDLGSEEVKASICKVRLDLPIATSLLLILQVPLTSYIMGSPPILIWLLIALYHLSQVFVTAHQSVEATSRRMLAQLSRQNYVTPTNYLETVRGYRSLLKEKRAELGDKANKLKGGLEKLDETSVQVRSHLGVTSPGVIASPGGNCLTRVTRGYCLTRVTRDITIFIRARIAL